MHLHPVCFITARASLALLQQGQVIEAKLLSIDPSSCKVWLSMRQVHPDPLQETLDSLLSGDLSTFGDTDSTPQILGESTSADELAVSLKMNMTYACDGSDMETKVYVLLKCFLQDELAVSRLQSGLCLDYVPPINWQCSLACSQ